MSSKILTFEQIKVEENAQRRREEAKKYLDQVGQSIEKIDVKTSKKGNDNTLELLLAEKRKLAGQLVTPTANIISTTNTTKLLDSSKEKLLKNWQAVSDSSTGKTYYWNITTNETTWEKPVIEAESEKIANEAEKKELPANWIEKIHTGTMQSYWIHEKTGNKRWTLPDYDDDGSSVNPPSSLSKRANTVVDNSNKKQRIQPIGPQYKK